MDKVIKETYSTTKNPLRRLRVEGMSFLMSPPEINSNKTSVELELLENIGRRIKDEDKDAIRRYNGNVLSEFYHVLNQFSLNCDKCEMEDLVFDVKTIVEQEKVKHGRPRPCEIGKKQGFALNEEAKFNSNPSYPCGHATESMFLALYLAEEYPLYKDIFMETANKIANSRLLSSNNYPTDNLAGQTLAYVLYNRYKEDKE